MLGRAAHITAAASGGPRFDIRLTPAERKDANNGIWLCATCANLIDADEGAYSEQQIRDWKRSAQKRARLELVLSHAQSGPGAPFGAEEIADALNSITDAAQTRLETLRRIATWPPHPIPLSMSLVEDSAAHSLQAESLAGVLDTYDDIALVAAPGTGKTTTMLQIADAIIERRTSVAAVILLAEWSIGGDTLLRYLSQQAGFRDVPFGPYRAACEKRQTGPTPGWME